MQAPVPARPNDWASMLPHCLLLIPAAFAISLPLCALLIRVGHRLGALDGPGVAGQVKAEIRRVPNTGGVGIVAAFVLPVVLGVVMVATGLAGRFVPDEVAEHLPGMAQRVPLAAVFLAGILALHVVGLIDDRRPLGPFLKLGVIVAAALAVSLTDQTRLLTLLDGHVGGAWLSVAITVLWIVVVTNAFNFMDNMDGLSAGSAACASACFMVAAALNGQWFIAACLALLIGALLGFLVFNAPPARLFMGDGGSLVIGYILAVLTVRTTYYDPAGVGPREWHAVFMPLVILAVPLYDFVSVVVIRLSQGRSPLVGDLQHFSHRLVRHGLSRRAAVGVIWGFTLVTGISGVLLASLDAARAVLVGVQTLLILGVIGAFEYASSDRRRARRSGDGSSALRIPPA